MRPVIACLPALLTVFALFGCDRQKADAPQGEASNATAPANQAAATYPTGRLDRSHAGSIAPNTGFEDPQGRPVTLASFRGKPLLINFWATWCGPCIVEMPALDRLAAREGETLKVLTISQDTDGRAAVTQFFRARNFQHLEAYLDGETALMMALQLDTLPTTILYDAEGREVWRMTGATEWEGERATRLLTEAEGG